MSSTPNLPTSFSHTTILGFGHRARQGKDEAARVLERTEPGRVRRFAFADALRAYCRVHYGMTIKDAPLLQRVGVEMREKDPLVWVRTVLWSIDEWDKEARGPQLAVITDVRFPNEAEAVRSLGGKLVSVERYTDGERFIPKDRDPNHISEVALKDPSWWDRVVVNDASLAEFYHRVITTAHELAPNVIRPAAFMPVVYVSGKFRDTDAWRIEQNIRRAEELSLDVWKMGMAAICPHANTRFFQGSAPDDLWMEGDLAIVDRCDAVLTVDNWTDSEGAKLEVARAAQRGIPVFHSLDHLSQWKNRITA